MKTQCSNCLGAITVSPSKGTVTARVAASGRGSKRVEARILTSQLVEEEGLWAWEAPCCPDYWDSLEVEP